MSGQFLHLAILGLSALLLILIAWKDAKARIISNASNLTLLALGGGEVWIAGRSLADAVIGAGLGLLFLLLLAEWYRYTRKADGIGYGDVKFAAAAGFWTGWQGVSPLLLIAALLALVWAALKSGPAIQASHEGVTMSRALPFGPFLCLALSLIVLAQRFFPLLIPEAIR